VILARQLSLFLQFIDTRTRSQRPIKAMRRRIALLKRFVRNYDNLSSVLRKLWECASVIASLFIELPCRRDGREH
jgi:hypothetical protein